MALDEELTEFPIHSPVERDNCAGSKSCLSLLPSPIIKRVMGLGSRELADGIPPILKEMGNAGMAQSSGLDVMSTTKILSTFACTVFRKRLSPFNFL
jgi:hypothetical protein